MILVAKVYFAAGYDTVRQKRPELLWILPSPVLDGVSITIAARAKRSERGAHLSPSSTVNSDIKIEKQL